jgi:hypothetical protein
VETSLSVHKFIVPCPETSKRGECWESKNCNCHCSGDIFEGNGKRTSHAGRPVVPHSVFLCRFFVVKDVYSSWEIRGKLGGLSRTRNKYTQRIKK